MTTCVGCKWAGQGHCHGGGGCMNYTKIDRISWTHKLAPRRSAPVIIGLDMSEIKIRSTFIGIPKTLTNGERYEMLSLR